MRVFDTKAGEMKPIELNKVTRREAEYNMELLVRQLQGKKVNNYFRYFTEFANFLHLICSYPDAATSKFAKIAEETRLIQNRL